MKINTDCRHFDGYKPCAPHKTHGMHCEQCSEYDPVKQRILILKLGAAGEVIRCTPILHYLRSHMPQASITWVTAFPDLLPDTHIDRVITLSWETAEWLKSQHWNLVLSLDKELTPCALAKQLHCDVLKGFTLNDKGQITAADTDSEFKWHSGVFDDLMRANRVHYVEEIFRMCGWAYSNETYILPLAQHTMLNPLPGKGPVIGLNTGAGAVWPTRIWPVSYFEKLIQQLRAVSLQPVLLGGPDEHDRNVELAKRTGATYHGIRPLRQFLSVVDSCDVVVTSVTMALHMAIGLKKRIVLFNNIFNRYEFHLFGLGEILEPKLECLACYKRAFDAQCPVSNCMELIRVDDVMQAVARQVSQSLSAASQRHQPSPPPVQ